MNHITFELEQTDREKEYCKKFKEQPFAQRIIIRNCGNVIGHIFTPSGSGNDIGNAIQICGFTEAFDLWGCGVFKGYKDIQLLFDDGIMGGKAHFNLNGCCRCFRNPCQCENKISLDKCKKQIEQLKSYPLPFNVKFSNDIKDRLNRLDADSEVKEART